MRVQKGSVMLGGSTAYAAQQVGTIPPLTFVPFALLCCLHTNSADLMYSDNSRQKRQQQLQKWKRNYTICFDSTLFTAISVSENF